MTFPIMPFVFIVLMLLPIRLEPRQLKVLAFALWGVGGLMLTYRGVDFLLGTHPTVDIAILATFAAVSVAIGIAKGKFVLSKTSQRNIERLDQMVEPHRPIFVYSRRSWIIIGVMVLISLSLTWFNTPLLWRGAINIGIGLALIMSSLAYVKALRAQPTA